MMKPALFKSLLMAPGVTLVTIGVVMIQSNPNGIEGYAIGGAGILLIVVKYIVTNKNNDIEE